MAPNHRKTIAPTVKMTVLALGATLIASTAAVATGANLKTPAVHVEDPSGSSNVVRVQLVDDIGASERINYSGKLRMLSQRIAAATCNFGAGVEADLSRDILVGGTEEFEKIVNALTFGDPSMNVIGEEKRRKTLYQIDKLNEVWAPFRGAVETVLKTPTDEGAFEIVATKNMPLLDEAKKLVSEVSGQYSNPAELLQADALVVDIAGRQRMLTQKMSKEACALWSGHGTPEVADALKGTMNIFDVSLTALRSGMADAGIQKAPTEEIATGLDAIWTDWQDIKARLTTLSDNGELDAATQAKTFKDLNSTLVKMNKVVGMYAAFAKRKH